MNALKRATFEAAVARHHIFVTVLCGDGVELPEGYRYDGITLEYGLDMPMAPQDLETNEDGIRAELSFNHRRTATFVPWPAIVRMFVPGVLLAHWAVTMLDGGTKGEKPKLGLVS